MEESSSPEDTFLRGIDSTSTQLDDAANVATSTQDDAPPATQTSEDFSIGPGNYFSMKPFTKNGPEVVDSIPANINGKKFYMTDLEEGDNYTKKYKDGRYFAVHSSRRRGFRGVRKVVHARETSSA